MALSKKHFNAISQILRDTRAYEIAQEDAQITDGLLYLVADDLARLFKQDNPRFDRARFMAACTPAQEGNK